MLPPQFIRATRVQIVCPAGTAALYRATNRIIALLLDEESIRSWGGFTYSSIVAPAFTGQFWYTPESGVPRWVPDENVLIILDVPNELPVNILEYFIQLRDKINQIYKDEGESQRVLWITAQPLQIPWEDGTALAH